jgi:Rod binding domain-containing protein
MANDLQSIGDLAISQANATASGNVKLHGKASVATIDKNSKDFESMFITQMLQPMFEGIGVDPLFGGGHGEEMMRSFLVQEYGKAMSANGHLGIASAVKNAMIKAQDISATNIPTANQGAAYAAAQ